MDGVIIQCGVHYRKIDTDLSAQKTQDALQILDQPGIVDALRAHPVERISFARSPDREHSAWYDYPTKSISINSARKAGIHFGDPFVPGRSWNMSASTPDKLSSMRRSLLQEVAHHIQATMSGVEDVVLNAWDNTAKNPITRYARQDPDEYFAESLVAYVVERQRLLKHDAVGARMVVQAIALMRIGK